MSSVLEKENITLSLGQVGFRIRASGKRQYFPWALKDG